MTKSKNTKRALLTSVLSMMLCMAMLITSTFAWFTDSAISGKNKIVAGNLDVELEYATEFDATGAPTKWEKVDENTSLFNESSLWEPGHTEVAVLKIRNTGSLALKYKMWIDSTEKYGKNLANKNFYLSDYLVFNRIDGGTKKAREAYWDAELENTVLNDGVQQSNPTFKGLEISERTLEAGKEEIFTMAIYMPTSVGNEANHKTNKYNLYTPSITFGLNVMATQVEHESDSFGPDYDASAEYKWDGKYADTEWYDATKDTYSLKNAAELNGLAELAGKTDFTGKTVTLENDIDLEGNTLQISTFDGTFDGQGHEIKGVSKTLFTSPKGTAENPVKIQNVVITGDTTNTSLVASSPTYVHIDNVTTNGSVTSTSKAAAAVVGQITLSTSAPGEVLKITNCTNNADITLTKNGSYAGYEAGGIIGYVRYAAGATVVIENCVNNGAIQYENEVFSGSSGTAFGGIVGTAANTTISKCFNNGVIKGADSIGGIVGTCMSGTEITNCYNTGLVTAVNPEALYVGGIVGVDSAGSLIVDCCYNIGMVSGGKVNSGIVGGTQGTGDHYTKCYYLEGTATQGFGTHGKSDAEGKYISKTEAEMKQAATYVDWNPDIWNLTNGAFPKLK